MESRLPRISPTFSELLSLFENEFILICAVKMATHYILVYTLLLTSTYGYTTLKYNGITVNLDTEECDFGIICLIVNFLSYMIITTKKSSTLISNSFATQKEGLHFSLAKVTLMLFTMLETMILMTLL